MIAVACYAAAYTLRCPMSPPISLNILALSAFALAAALLLFFWISSEILSQKQVLWFGMALYGSALMLACYAILFSDSIGRFNWRHSAGLQCFL